ncbi:RDD family protein [Ferrimonas aestuarii]|uniref:RDD family protein n=1 Tax=Ferrimonas aestuarii TaxID=2569539 RepID=A0A4U1BLU5_9GAMM|nr:RDD family protein [Ferrimonas aestuarii]TKB54272.1 RDD family protein [Ferrimonas aestuarii]
MNQVPDFYSYTYDELIDAKNKIDKDSNPEQYREIVHLLSIHTPESLKVAKVEAYNEQKYQTLWRRLGALFVDYLLLVGLFNLQALALGIEFDWGNKLLMAWAGIESSIYFVLMHGVLGKTLGKWLFRVQVVDVVSEAKISLWQSLLRESVFLFFSVSSLLMFLFMDIDNHKVWDLTDPIFTSNLILGLLSAGWTIANPITAACSNKARALHDWIGTTVVVRSDLR